MRNPLHQTVIVIVFVAITMFFFTFAMVPIYNVLCKKIGLNTAKALLQVIPDFNRTITIQFVTSKNQNLPWTFYPLQTQITVHPGENKKVFFYVKNNSDHTMRVQAIPSLTPPFSIQYFHKIQCFCFEQQTLKAGQSLKMPLIFQIDPAIPDDMNTLTLAYTLFDLSPFIKKELT